MKLKTATTPAINYPTKEDIKPILMSLGIVLSVSTSTAQDSSQEIPFIQGKVVVEKSQTQETNSSYPEVEPPIDLGGVIPPPLNIQKENNNSIPKKEDEELKPIPPQQLVGEPVAK